jgi:hypothetical protein
MCLRNVGLRTTRCYKSEDRSLHSHRHANFNSNRFTKSDNFIFHPISREIYPVSSEGGSNLVDGPFATSPEGESRQDVDLTVLWWWGGAGTWHFSRGKGKAIPITGRRGPEGCETSRLSHFLDSRLTDGGEIVILTRWTLFTPRKIPGIHFC